MKRYQRMVQDYAASVRKVSANFSQTDVQSILIPWEREKKRNLSTASAGCGSQTSFTGRKNSELPLLT